jgi:uncharacterized protein YidB (DUF937 family)
VVGGVGILETSRQSIQAYGAGITSLLDAAKAAGVGDFMNFWWGRNNIL